MPMGGRVGSELLLAKMSRGVDVRPARAAHGESQRVADFAAQDDFVVSHEAGKDRKPCGVGAGPTPGAKRVARHIEDRARPAIPARAAVARPGIESFIESPRITV